MTSRVRSRLAIVCAAILFSTGGAAIKGTELSAMQVSCLRSAIGALVLALAVQPWRRRLSARAWLVGAGYAAVVTLYVAGNKLTTSAHAIYLQSTAPIYVIALSAWQLRQPPRRGDLWSAGALLAGITLLLFAAPTALSTATHPALGNLLALLAGLCWALTVMGLSQLSNDAGPRSALDAAFAGNLMAAVTGMPFLFTLEGLTTPDLLAVTYLGVFQIALAYLILARGMRSLGPIEVSLLLLVEPLLNPFWAWWLHSEQLTPIAVLGCALILAASAQRALVAR